MMMGQRIQMRRLTQIIALVALGIFWGAYNKAGAEEQRCADLGAACVCSEPLQATAYVQVGSLPYYNPNDSTTKECSGESPSVRGGFIIRNPPVNFTASSNATVLGALPSGHTVARVFKGNEGHTNLLESGHVLAVGGERIPLQRVAARWYQYFSTNYVWAHTATCLNSGKFATFYTPDLGPQLTTRDGGGEDTWYGWARGWNIDGLDCCVTFPGQDPRAENTAAERRGKWFRYELVFGNATGTAGMHVQLFSKNITDGNAEKILLDSFVSCPTCGTSGLTADGWTTANGAVGNLNPLGALTRIEFNQFRNGVVNNGTDCPGFVALSHAMIAAWNSDAGQRIGAAVEIEARGGEDTLPPAPPADLRVSKLVVGEE